MTFMKALEKHEVESVHDWLRMMSMPVNRQIHRDYADGVLVAKLLKKLYPRLIDLHSYPTRFNYDLKVVNWQTLHFKALSRIGLPLTKQQIDFLAKGEMGTIERFFWVLMNVTREHKNVMGKTKSQLMQRESKDRNLLKPHASSGICTTRDSLTTRQRRSYEDASNLSQKNLSSTTFNINTKHTGQIVDVSEQGMVPFAVYESAINEVRAKENVIRSFKAKMALLETILKDKDFQIMSLQRKTK